MIKNYLYAIFLISAFPGLTFGENKNEEFPIEIILSIPEKSQNFFALQVVSLENNDQIYISKQTDIKFDMVIIFKNKDGKLSVKSAPVRVSLQKPYDGDKQDLKSISGRPLNVQNLLDKFLNENIDLFNDAHLISRIEIRAIVRGLIIGNGTGIGNFTDHQIYSAKLFSDWIKVSPDLIYSLLEKSSSGK